MPDERAPVNPPHKPGWLAVGHAAAARPPVIESHSSRQEWPLRAHSAMQMVE
jgi:hypothetical protein